MVLATTACVTPNAVATARWLAPAATAPQIAARVVGLNSWFFWRPVVKTRLKSVKLSAIWLSCGSVSDWDDRERVEATRKVGGVATDF